MLAADVAAAADAVRRGDWGDREAFLRFAASLANCRPILAERDGEIVGTGVTTVSGRVGWVGTNGSALKKVEGGKRAPAGSEGMGGSTRGLRDPAVAERTSFRDGDRL